MTDRTTRHNRRIHATSLGLTKLADGLIDPKLVLAWLMTALGAPAAMIGLLVPIREAGALLPQLFISGRIRATEAARHVWAMGSAVQGLAAGGIALAVLLLQGPVAGGAILACLAVLALARSVCSASYKHVLGKTVPKSERGQTTGLAGSLSAVGILGFAAILAFGPGPSLPLIAGAVALAAGLWLLAAANFTRLDEPAKAQAEDTEPLAAMRENLGLLKTEPQLRAFILTRGLLIATALAPPFVVTLSAASLDRLGWMVAASALAALVSAWVWGWLSDRSSRKVLALAGLLAALTLAGVALAGRDAPGAVSAALLFLLMIAHQGVRLGRSTHLTDMADAGSRAGFTAVSNTVIGVLLLLGGLYGAVAGLFGTVAVIWIFAAQSLLGARAALRLREVQRQ
ncbi:MFS transporter [Halovulum dunhuangense]|uniref:MFS transporter n=1 Tax=Halovulum dunhuangense TaxID=1505036 RepID=A0A849L0E8_9RHOB|nr:MFS transporter [Halovulum dunhuangense]NNU79733.1 MFS transporter [Halovulum dunhuangense]